jgi:beta-N-acetylhexosaminidase
MESLAVTAPVRPRPSDGPVPAHPVIRIAACAALMLALAFSVAAEGFTGAEPSVPASPMVRPAAASVSTVETAEPVSAESVTFWSELPADKLASLLLSRMSDDEIIGQVFMLSYAGTTPTRAIRDWIRTRNIGGVKIFGWNAEDLRVLTGSIGTMQTLAAGTPLAIPLLVATDQEGGWVRHVKGSTTETPGNLAIGASGLPYDAFASGYYIGRELHALGINMNFAPTIDIYTNPDAHVIGPRAFSEDPVQVGSLAVAFYRGMRRAGIVSTAKHFPGHGNADEDSHGTLPVVEDRFETLWERELVPYRFLIKEGIPAIMTGHLAFPNTEGGLVPASLSRYFVTQLLRDRLGFGGIVVTDDLYMYGARNDGRSIAEVCVRALEAGNDMVMLSRTPELNDEVWRAVSGKYRSDESFRASIKASVERILRIKLEYLKGARAVPTVPDRDALDDAIPDREGLEFFLDQACRSVTVLRDRRIPYTPKQGERVLIVSPLADFFEEAAKRFPNAGRFPYPLYVSNRTEARRLAETARSYDTVIFCLVNEHGTGYLQALEPLAEKVIVFSVLSPVYMRGTPWVQSALAVYGWSLDTYRAGFSVLAGEFPAHGVLPVTVFPDG